MLVYIYIYNCSVVKGVRPAVASLGQPDTCSRHFFGSNIKPNFYFSFPDAYFFQLKINCNVAIPHTETHYTMAGIV